MLFKRHVEVTNQDFETIWNTYQQKVLNFIRSKFSDEARAQDILQEVFLKLLQAYDAGIEIKNIQSWLFQVTRNTIHDHFRKDFKVSRIETQRFENQVDTTVQGCVCDLTGFIIKNYLPKKYGDPLHMSDIENYAQKDIAEKLGLTLSGAKSRIQRGRKLLKELILNCVDVKSNHNGGVVDYQLKPSCEIPAELQEEIKKQKIVL